MKLALAILALSIAGCGGQVSSRVAVDPFPSWTVQINADVAYLAWKQQQQAATQPAMQPKAVQP